MFLTATLPSVRSATRVAVAAMGLLLWVLLSLGCARPTRGEAVPPKAANPSTVEVDLRMELPSGGGLDGGAVGGDLLGGAGENRWKNESIDHPQKKEGAINGGSSRGDRARGVERRVSLPSDGSFERESIALHPSLLQALDQLSNILRKESRPIVSIVGHTDRSEDPASQRSLSLARASSVRDYLAQRGVNPARISIKGLGATRPVESHAKDQSEAKNRRVEIYHREPPR